MSWFQSEQIRLTSAVFWALNAARLVGSVVRAIVAEMVIRVQVAAVAAALEVNMAVYFQPVLPTEVIPAVVVAEPPPVRHRLVALAAVLVAMLMLL